MNLRLEEVKLMNIAQIKQSWSQGYGYKDGSGTHAKFGDQMAKKTVIKKTKSSKNAVRLYWKKVSCTGYKIQMYDTSAKKWKTVKIVSSKKTNAAISGLTSAKSYKFRIVPFTRTSGKTVTGKVSKAVKVRTR